MKTTVNERVKLLRTHLGLGQNEFGGKAGLSGPSIWRIEQNEVVPQRKTIKSIAEAHKASMDWLLTGNGAMMLPATIENSTNPYQDTLYKELKEQIEFLKETIRMIAGKSESATAKFKALNVPASFLNGDLRAQAAA